MPELEYCENAYQAAEGADLLVIMTEWNQFRNLDWARLKKVMTGRVVVDLRNVYPPQLVRDEGFSYISVGRPMVLKKSFLAFSTATWQKRGFAGG